MVKLSKIGFLATLIGGLAGIVFGILNLVAIPLFTSWYIGGAGLLGWLIATPNIIWPILVLVFATLALLIGVLKTFTELLEFDLLIWGIIIIILGALVWGIPGWLIVVGGLLVIIGRFVE
ncbi:MAG: hypothetical protein FK734_12760 [Asgard group archaeon]|nr:hypothetical protein [Asgard group archaeon]